MLNILLLSLAISVCSVTITKGSVFDGLRDWIWIPSQLSANVVRKFFGELSRCPYCMSHWVSAGAVAIGGPIVKIGPLAMSYVVSWLVCVGFATFFSTAIILCLEAWKSTARK